MRKAFLGFLGLATMLCACAGAPDRARADDDTGWEALGSRVVAPRAERDVIPVTRAEGLYSKIRLRVAGHGVEILDLKVHFTNGGTHDVAVRERIAPGGHTRVIDLPGGPRGIRSINLTYRTAGRDRDRATVTVFGKKVADGPAPDGPAAAGPDAPRADDDAGWELLGRRDVNWGVDHDVIVVTGKEGRFKRIRLKVVGSPIHFNDLNVHFGNDESIDVSVRDDFRPGSYTRVIDLPGDGRVIRKITMWYRKIGIGGGPATVQVWGRQDGAAAAPTGGADEHGHAAGGAADDDSGWEVLGRRNVNWGVDHDVIPVTAAEGRFKRIRLKVTGHAIHVRDLKVHFGNDEVFDVEVRDDFRPGSSTRVIELPGDERVIRKVTMWYRKIGPRPGAATVTVYGRH